VRVPRVSDVPESSGFESAVLPKRTRLSMATQKLFARLLPRRVVDRGLRAGVSAAARGNGAAVTEHAAWDQGRVGGGVQSLAGTPRCRTSNSSPQLPTPFFGFGW
jgi:hypothetical protein